MNKCRIVPSGTMTRHFCKKIIKQLGLSESIILDIGDLDDNGRYDIKDFLEMKNSELLKMNQGKKFDICLMNPPYSKDLHIKFLEKTIQCADNVISIQPIDFLIAQDHEVNIKSKRNVYKDIITHINKVEKISQDDANTYFGIDQFADLGILIADQNIHDIDFIKDLNIDDYRIILKKICEYKDNFRNHKGKVLGKYFTPIYADIRVGYAISHGASGTILFSDKGIVAKRGFTKESIESHGRGMFINFDTEEEAYNFKNYCKLDLVRAIGYIIVFTGGHHSGIMPFMPDYNKEWTNEMVAKELKLTSNEVNTIIELFNKVFRKNKK